MRVIFGWQIVGGIPERTGHQAEVPDKGIPGIKWNIQPFVSVNGDGISMLNALGEVGNSR